MPPPPQPVHPQITQIAQIHGQEQTEAEETGMAQISDADERLLEDDQEPP